jgi:hypothetical protein
MSERSLQLVLRLVGVFLYLGPLLVAFSVHKGNVLAMAVPSREQLDRVGQKMENLLNFSDNVMQKESYRLNENGGEAVVRFTNSSPYPILLENFTGYSVCKEHGYPLAWFQLKEKVKIGPGENGRLEILFYPTPGASFHVLLGHLGFWPETKVENGLMEIEMLRAKIKIRVNQHGT